ncbi:pilus assembly PilX N-terminal domain-containing protein [Demequina pelophila]|uniref:pilus assembly PilX N-terminal domain-containing protein n=1 Tax=Demequina pelophila TaxID=1638984 RepID=UPI0007849E9F|nr:pilus assembly PilX N-terminal domain-containing protein [Demequina pelophila]
MRSRRAGSGSDAGLALVMTLMLMLIGSIIVATLVAVAVFNSGVTSKTRAEMRVLASADAGIDLVMNMIDGLKHEELGSVCSPTFTINNDSVVVETEYTVVTASGASETKACPASTDVTRALTVRSTATSANVPVANEVLTRTVEAVLFSAPEQASLDKAIFSEGSTEITSNTQVDESSDGLADANVYTNGGIVCETQLGIEGEVIAANGDAYFKSACNLASDLWARGTVTFDSDTHVAGNIYSASTAATAISADKSGTIVDGSLISNGGITTTAYVGGNLVSLAGAIQLTGDGVVHGSVHSDQELTLTTSGSQDSVRVVGNAASNLEILVSGNKDSEVGGTATAPTIADELVAGSTVIGTAARPAIAGLPPALGYPTEVQRPVREPMPKLEFGPDDLTLWQVAGYSVREVNLCADPDPLDYINSWDWSDGSLLVVFQGCDTPVMFSSKSDMNVGGNLALVSESGFRFSNQLNILASGTDRPDLHFIVPAESPNVTWTEVAGTNPVQESPTCTAEDDRKTANGANAPVTQDIYFDKVKNDGADIFVYTPCTVDFNTGWDMGANNDYFTGQVYGGSVDIHNSFDMRMAKVDVPSAVAGDPTPEELAELKLLSRYDLFG